MDGGLGDHIASLVAVNYILETYTWITPLIWVPDYLKDLSKNMLPESAQVYSFTDMRGRYDQSRPTKTTKWDGHTSPMKIHCVDYAFLKLCDENPDISKKNYLKIMPDHANITAFDLPDDYVVLTTGFTASVREFPAEHINGIASYIKAIGLTPVFLGQTTTKTGANHVIKGTFSDEIDFSSGISLIDKTSLLESAKIMGQAKAVLGVDNGLLHLAGCTDVPIIGGFTTVSPDLRMPIRNNKLGDGYLCVTPDESLGCKFCQVRTNFLYGHNYVNCLYKDNLCTKQMTATKFIAQLEKIL